ncbi:armadillo-type protein [Dichotomocladium elegans]|nr:armadillo-type protein [Dichotomocladium elegans]
MEIDTNTPQSTTEFMDEDPVNTFANSGSTEAQRREQDDLFAVALLIDELRHDDAQYRLNAIKNLTVIAQALGPERTRNELLPFLQECIDDEDEVLLVLAEELGNLAEYLGGHEYTYLLLVPLENIAAVEENSVREKAVASLCRLATILPSNDIATYFLPLLKRLSLGVWFTSRTSAVGLYAAVYSRVSPIVQAELRNMFSQLVRDDSPMVRRSAAKALKSFAVELSKEDLLGGGLELLQLLAQDSQDSVRLLAAEDIVAFGKIFDEDENQNLLLPIFHALAQDKSWRVRYMVASEYVLIAQAFGPSIVKEHFTESFLNFLSDPEGEVRTAAAGRITGYAQLIDKQVVIGRLLPCVKNLVADENQHSRAALAKEVSGLALIVGQEPTMEYLLPTFLQQLTDDFPDVRLNIISSLDEINKAIGVERLSQALLPAIHELSEDKQWRIRLAIIEHIPLLAKQFGPQFFEEKLLDLCMGWLRDKVFSIREAATANLQRLTHVFGAAWAQEAIIPKIQKMAVDDNYLHRMIVIFALTIMAEALPIDTVRDSVMPTVIEMSNDPIPNIRFNVAKSLETMIPLFKQNKATATLVSSLARPTLEKLSGDTDGDVRFFANRALETI